MSSAYIFDRDDKSVTRWTISDELKLEEGETVSFQNAGVVDACAICNVFGDATHAYMVDSSGGVPHAYYSFTGFRYAVLDLATLESTVVGAIPPAGAGNNTPLVLDGVNLIQVYPEGSRTVGADLFAIGEDGSATKVLEAGASGDFEMVGRLQR